jgi:putative ubiquitin-RnfH superfamily antitoxin RatB of RatAB toxin-antitoxin module
MVSESEIVKVEVAYARADQQVILELDVPVGTTVEQAIKESGVLDSFPEIDLEKNKVGIFGKLTKLVTALNAGDRVEIYRALIADPKEVRRQREAEGKLMKKGGSD